MTLILVGTWIMVFGLSLIIYSLRWRVERLERKVHSLEFPLDPSE